MNDLLRKMALAFLESFLRDPNTLKALEIYVDGQVDGFVGAEADRLVGAANPLLKFLGQALKDTKTKDLLNSAVNAELDQLYKVLLDRLHAGAATALVSA